MHVLSSAVVMEKKKCVCVCMCVCALCGKIVSTIPNSRPQKMDEETHPIMTQQSRGSGRFNVPFKHTTLFLGKSQIVVNSSWLPVGSTGSSLMIGMSPCIEYSECGLTYIIINYTCTYK